MELLGVEIALSLEIGTLLLAAIGALATALQHHRWRSGRRR